MSRKRDTNWTRDEITILLDSIMEITKARAEDGKRTNSKEVFDFAAKRLGEKGHAGRAEREKCRTKWKKMKEEYTYAKKAREGNIRYKESPGIQPFFDRMEEFIRGNFDNISPHSTIVRRSSSISSHTTDVDTSKSLQSRSSSRIAASNVNGTSISNDNTDTSSTIVTKTNASAGYSSPPIAQTPSNSSSNLRQNSRLSSSGSSNSNTNNNNNNLFPLNVVTTSTTNSTLPEHNNHNHHHHQQQKQAISNGQLCTIYTSYNNSDESNKILNNSDSSNPPQPADQADISYRVSTGCRQITIFGDHDVDIKFRGDCVTINKINSE